MAAVSWASYSYINQSISELSAVGAPTRLFLTITGFVFNLLLVLFGVGVWLAGGEKLTQRITGVLIALWGVANFAWFFFPMNMRGTIGSTSDTGHLILTAITVFTMTMFIGFGSFIKKGVFRLYSFLTIFAMLLFGALVGSMVPQVIANLPTPWMGIMERVSAFSPMLWLLFLATILLNNPKIK